MTFLKNDPDKNGYMLHGKLRRQGYDWWWHSFTGHSDQGEEKTFFVEFFVINPGLGEKIPVLGQDPSNKSKDKKPSYLMVKCGAWGEDAGQLHRFFAMRDVKIARKGLRVRAGDCLLQNGRLKGHVVVTDEQAMDSAYMCEAGEMRFDLKIKKLVPFNVGYGTCTLFRKLNAFEMYWHASGIKSAYEGTVEWNGETYHVTPETSYGYADKNWGSDFTKPWLWLSSSDLTSNLTHKRLENSVFDIGGGRPGVFGIHLNRQLLSAFLYEGTPYEFNFSKFWTLTRTKFACHETDTDIVWHVEQRNRTHKMVTDITCPKKEMLKIWYESPQGIVVHQNLWNGGTGTGRVRLYKRHGLGYELIDDMACAHTGCEYGD